MPLRFVVLFLLFFTCTKSAFAIEEASWKEKKGSHFLIYEQEESSFAAQVLDKAEDFYQDEIRYFGTLPENSFWSWENRCKIYLYHSRAEYMTQTRQPEWSSGYADVKRRAIVSYEDAPDFLESVLPHEMAHLIFREFIEADNQRVPRWLDEGFAIAQESAMRTSLDETIRKAVRSNSTIPLRDLNAVGSLHNHPAEQARLFYAQAQSLTRFLLEDRDSSYFVNFCRALRDGLGLEEALRKSYGSDFSSLDTFEKNWKRYVLES